MSVVEYLHGVVVGVAKELTHNSTLKPELHTGVSEEMESTLDTEW